MKSISIVILEPFVKLSLKVKVTDCFASSNLVPVGFISPTFVEWISISKVCKVIVFDSSKTSRSILALPSNLKVSKFGSKVKSYLIGLTLVGKTSRSEGMLKIFR